MNKGFVVLDPSEMSDEEFNFLLSFLETIIKGQIEKIPEGG